MEAPSPKNLHELKSYLGMLMYYGRFLPNLSHELHALFNLLKNNSEFNWDATCEQVFVNSKRMLLENRVLAHYDPQLPIVVHCDASPYGVGAVLSHIINGTDHPVLFASRTLSDAEKNYSQLHREALAIIFGIKKFHKYIYGHKFTIISDHQPLREIFNPKKGTPAVAAARLQRWAALLSQYDYEIEYRAASKLAHADALSRLPLPAETGVESFINYF